VRSEGKILKNDVLSLLAGLLGEDRECYLVGGAIRDALLGRPVSDFDFAMPRDPTELARSFAERCGGTWFFLDEERRQSRVVRREGEEEITCDFAPFRSADLPGDLRLRDFTVNALALRLGSEAGILDPLGGKDDLAAKRLRACSAGVFADDPLRVLKGIRHAAVLGFDLEEATRELMASSAGALSGVAPERLRAEMSAIFAVPDPISALDLLRDFDLDKFFFGPPGHHLGFRAAGRLLRRSQAVIESMPTLELLGEEIEGGLNRAALLRLAAFLGGYGREARDVFARRVRLGRKATAILRSLADLPVERAAEVEELAATRRGRALWAMELGADVWMSLLFLAVLDRRAPAEIVPAIFDLFADVANTQQDGRIPDLVDGDWIRRELGWSEGPAIGKALSRLRRQEIEGRVKSLAEARKFLKSLDQKMIDKKTGDPL